ncbi:MAG: Holliday junction resolvase RuvX [Chlamydiae bacterium]|nr:Holliday junction resolvase RuvX [Chlamydiota bacterium]MBI3266010.1 Holliday junction resolvase RuvX [Chlamydiota bacterium]
MIILALDFGEKRIGMAVSDSLGIIAVGLSTLERKDEASDLAAIDEVARERKVEKIVLGMPLHMSGREGIKAKEVLAFKEILSSKTGLPIDLYDERLTTVQAERVLLEADLSREKRKGKRDQLAAQIILQSYLERMRGIE